jgi:hypothetical protein
MAQLDTPFVNTSFPIGCRVWGGAQDRATWDSFSQSRGNGGQTSWDSPKNILLQETLENKDKIACINLRTGS